MISTDVSPMFIAMPKDWRLLAFVTGLSVLTCVCLGLTPPSGRRRSRQAAQ